MKRWVVVMGCLCACVESESVTCSDGRLCPVSTTCDEIHDACATAEAVAACRTADDGAPCEASAASGFCDAGVCVISICGNGKPERGEICDDGNLDSNDGCRGDCASTEECGNGELDPQTGEECDCGSTVTAVGCTAPNSDTSLTAICASDCHLRCGDGIVDQYELCDAAPPADDSCYSYGFDEGSLTCSTVCAPAFQLCRRHGWISIPALSGKTLRAMWGPSRSDLFVVEWGAISHFDGVKLTAMSIPSVTGLNAIWGRASDDVYVVGDYGVILHYDGTAWTTEIAPTTDSTDALDSIAGTSAVVVAGGRGRFVSKAAGGWVETPYTDTFTAATTFAGHVWLGGDSAAYEVDGTTLTQHLFPDSVTVNALAVVGSTLYAGAGSTVPLGFETFGLYHLDAAAFVAEPGWNFGGVVGLASTSAGLFAATTNGVRLFDGETYFQTQGPSARLVAIGDHPYSAGFGLGEFAGHGWSSIPTPAGTTGSIVTGARGFYATTSDEIVWRYTPALSTRWTQELTVPGASGAIALDRSSTAMLIATAQPAALAYSSAVGQPATTLTPPGTWSSSDRFWGLAMDGGAFFAYSVSGKVLRGTVTTSPATWITETPDPDVNWHDIWAADPTHAFLAGSVGNQGVIGAFANGVWTVNATFPQPLYAVWGSSASDVFAVGGVGSILHYDGVTWTVMDSNTSARLTEVVGSGPDDIYATDSFGPLMHYDGMQWSPVRSPGYGQAIAIEDEKVFIHSGGTALDILLRLY